MGSQANSIKERTCKICASSFGATAAELLDHVARCRVEKDINDRLEAIGLVQPQMSVDAAELLGNLTRNKKGPSMGGA